MNNEASFGTLPKSWRQSQLGQVAKWGSGGTPKANNSSYYGGNIPWVIIGDLNDGVITKTSNSITQLGLDESSSKLVPKGTLLIAMYGSIGKLGIAGMDLATNQAIAFANPMVGVVTHKYLFNYLASQKEIFLASGKGMTQQNISQTMLKSWPIPLPPIAEQEKIIEVLEEQLARLDAALASVHAVREGAERFRHSLLHAAFNGLLTGCDDSNGLVAADWVNIELGKVGKWITGSTPSTNDAENFGGITPFVTPGDISDQGILSEAKRSLSDKGLSLVRKVAPPSILLVCIGATLGKVAIANQLVATNQQINALEPNVEIVVPRFVELLLSSQAIQEQLWNSSSSTTVPIINKRKLESLRVNLPTRAEQLEIVKILDEQLSRLNSSLSIVHAIEKQSSALRRSLFHAAFTGELTKEWREGANV